MIFYIIILFILVFLTIKCSNNSLKGRSNIKYAIFIGIFFMLICGLRADSVGNDTIKYVELYKDINYSASNIFFNRFEPGFIYLNKALGKLSINPQIIIIMSSIIIWTGIIIFISNNSKNPAMSYFFIVTFGYMAFFMSGIRESIAISICLIGFEYVKEKRKILFFLSILLASTFHISAFVFLIAYPVFNLKLNVYVKLLMIIVSIIFMKQFDIIMLYAIEHIPKYASYLTTEYNDGIIRIATVINLLIISIIYIASSYYYRYQFGNENIYSGYLNLIFIGIPLLIVSLSFNLLDRFSNYFNIFIIIVIPNIICNRANVNHKLISFISMVCFLIYFICVQLLRPEWNGIYPYTLFWM
ncbi:EpsG family protein [Anaerococcus sp. NML200574]|uniref:EpsG family protein n=1 Tax=Anaerococcus sp. NML200574 TaxID=2954486 RepID=UPI00223822EF|nr:EpsG family protein [Anaerococcus sp. NML200574]MCW6677783.1 EpsG family protein [Anaerococcus sp. NML200574]